MFFLIVVAFNIAKYFFLSGFYIFKNLSTYAFSLEKIEKTFHWGIVMATPFSTHASKPLASLQTFLYCLRSVL